jgi:putative oxidoreductase
MLDLARRLRPLLDALAFVPPLLARLVIGLVFVPSGWGKLHDLPAVVDFFGALGIPAPAIQAPFVAGVELVCGALVLVGLGARVAAVPLVATMIVAIGTALWPEITGLGDLAGRAETLYAVLLAQIAVAGPGAASLDAVLARRLGRGPAHALGLTTPPDAYSM